MVATWVDLGGQVRYSRVGVVVLFGVASTSFTDEGRGWVRGNLDWLVGQSLLGEVIVEEARVRCSECRSAVPVSLLWAVGEICPRCSQSLNAVPRRSTTDGLVGKIALLHAESRSESRPGVANR
jgi:hypothetical protein